MNHADPWDEMARLEKQVEVELLAKLEPPPPTARQVRKPAQQTPKPPLQK